MIKYTYVFLAIIFIITGCNTNSLREPEEMLSLGGNKTKVNKKGRYISFPGVTAVADVTSTDRAFFDDLYSELSKIPQLTQYYALLPAKSYHMTTNNLYVKGTRKKWAEFLTDKLAWFQKFHKDLEAKAISPQAALDNIQVERVISLILTLDDEDRDKIYDFGKEFQVDNSIPSPFHITLAYLYKDIPLRIKKDIKFKVDKIFQKLKKKHNYQNKKLSLGLASLRYFDSMLEFIPWDGEALPEDLAHK
jgi:hypothetical protein